MSDTLNFSFYTFNRCFYHYWVQCKKPHVSIFIRSWDIPILVLKCHICHLLTFQAVTALICSNSCHRFSIALIGSSFGCKGQRCLKLAEISWILADFTQVADYLSISGIMLKITQIPYIPTIFCHFKQVKCQNVIKCHNFTQLCKTSSLSLDFIDFIWIEWKHTYTLLSNITWWYSVPKHCLNDLKCHQGSPCTITGDTF